MFMTDRGGETDTHVLTINPGSSSLKADLYRIAGKEHREIAMRAERIGAQGSHLTITDDRGATLLDRQEDLPDHTAALQALFQWLRSERGAQPFDAVGHRVVHGGLHYREPQRITPEMIAALRELTAIDPDHLPQALGVDRGGGRAYPDIPQVACFDTAFHRDMPPVAQLYALPRRVRGRRGRPLRLPRPLVRVHPASASRADDPAAADGRVVIAHLGNGASMAAVRDGVGVDTTMGFTPTGGLVMGTRTGDLDPGVLLYLLDPRGMAPADVSDLVNQQGRAARRLRHERRHARPAGRGSRPTRAPPRRSRSSATRRRSSSARSPPRSAGSTRWSSPAASASTPRRSASASARASSSSASRSTRRATPRTRRSSRRDGSRGHRPRHADRRRPDDRPAHVSPHRRKEGPHDLHV